uniref:NADH-ubiquinone oxidoreductase chain 5 n=2 Tax=Pneumocystis jirovecii TaxID=42068 RepID=A0A2S0X1B4_PNEJI|nr:NADH dehydrogenase subunit 5 [Pneumocystis jirovecii]AFR90403.2 NADH dehydrogenase subunit 5 [Pneumocystis jirovecii]AWB97827.1 NADH dehydrogenase subunit 5 [Pneumocystis jirovecii]AWB97873.1 NADH dehydrogenase subunit 5 [Pneumocystis jirovecii]
MYSTLLMLPFLSGSVVGLLGHKIGVKGCFFISILSILLTTLLGYCCFYEVVLCNAPVSLNWGYWLDLDSFSLSWKFLFDELTVSMLLPVLTISCLVQIYSMSYMSHDPHVPRFFCYLSFFTFFMLLLVSGDNFLILFIGWEGVGIMSFLLISFWFTWVQANKSALSAVLFNWVGDLFLIVALVLLIWNVGSLDFSIVFSLAPYINKTLILLIGICFVLAATGKSAQLGLHLWLPQAMEGPTPVSALIHAATMVTAGVYLLIWSSPLLEWNSLLSSLICGLGAATALFASLTGLFQNDLKWIIAYSTCSQLGMMFVAIGLSQYSLALFHLVNHAFFKALLFLSAGVVIHAFQDEQDIRKMGGLLWGMPLTYTFILIGSLSLMAFPFLTGFYSKDLIIEMSFKSSVFFGLLTVVAVFTSLYSFKLIYFTFLSKPSASFSSYRSLHDVPLSMILPLWVLSLLSLFWGYLTKDLFIGIGSSALGNSIFSFSFSDILDVEFGVLTVFKILPFILSSVAILCFFIVLHYFSYLLYYFKFSALGWSIYSFFNQRFGLDLLYTKFFVHNALKLGYWTSRLLDKGCLEVLGPTGVSNGLKHLYSILSTFDSGVLRHYAISICLAFLLILVLGFSGLDVQILWVILLTTVLVLT